MYCIACSRSAHSVLHSPSYFNFQISNLLVMVTSDLEIVWWSPHSVHSKLSQLCFIVSNALANSLLTLIEPETIWGRNVSWERLSIWLASWHSASLETTNCAGGIVLPTNHTEEYCHLSIRVNIVSLKIQFNALNACLYWLDLWAEFLNPSVGCGHGYGHGSENTLVAKM